MPGARTETGAGTPLAEAAGGALQLTDLIDVAVLQQLQDRFADATGVASIITTPAGEPITQPSRFSRLCRDVIRKTPRGLENCTRSDAVLGRPNPGGPKVSPCLSCGLWDGGASIFAGQEHIANWLIGQVRNEDLSDAAILAYAQEIDADPREFREAFHEVVQMPTERFRGISDFLFLMANQLSATAYQRLVQQREAREREALERELEKGRQLQAIGKLAGGVAHDFNNLLTVILGYVQALHQDTVEGRTDQRETLAMLDEIMIAGSRAADLTRQLLAFSRKQVSTPVDLDLGQVIGRFESVLRTTVPESVLFTLALEEGALIHADRSQVEQVLLNLVVNARDAMPQGGHLHVETATVLVDEEHARRHPEAQVGPHVRLTVSDTGVGMSAAVRARLFEPFFTTKGPGLGTGLGLATTWGVVRQAGGHVAVTSEEGQGSAFLVYWPRGAGAAQSLDVSVPPENLRGNETVLLCEDSPQVRALAARILERAGYQVIATGSGAEALRRLEDPGVNPAALVTDVIMPGLSGKELGERMVAARPGLQVVYMSGYTDEIIGNHGVLDTSVRLIEKPFTPTSLLAAVRRALDTPR